MPYWRRGRAATFCRGSLGSGAIDVGLNGYAARHFSARHVNWLHGCWGIGASIGPAVMTFSIAGGHGYRSGYALLGGALGSLTLLFLLTRRRWDEALHASASHAAASDGAVVGAVAAASGAGPGSLHAVLRSERVWLQLLVFFLYTGVEASVGQWCFSWLRDRRGLGIEAAGGWTSAYWASLTVGRLVFGGFVDRVGPDRMLRAATFGAVISAALFVSTAGLVGSLGLVLLGLALAPVFPTLMARTPSRLGAGLAHHAVGLQVSAGVLGSAVMPSAIGFLVAHQGLGAVGSVLVAGAAALLLAHELLLVRVRVKRG